MAKIKEECGVFGIYDLDGENVATSIYYGLTALQHRGQEACGIAVSDTNGPIGNVKFHKDLGLVSEVLRENTIRQMDGDIGIGHVRYSTTGASVAENAQPLVLSYVKGSLALAHNGNLVNTPELKWELIQSGAVFHTTTDSEVIAFYIARERVESQKRGRGCDENSKEDQGCLRSGGDEFKEADRSQGSLRPASFMSWKKGECLCACLRKLCPYIGRCRLYP